MKANELRIGNKVSFEGSIVTVNTISDEEVTFSDYASFDYPQIEDISGIELTEEWLNKFSSDGHYIFLNDEKGGAIDFSDIDNIYLVNEWFENFPLNKIQYVHSLQNLYFALTGEELELNEI